MTFETFLALIGILTAASWTPGPNNAMLAASAATFGFRRTVPHILGVSLGFPLMLFAVAMGLGEVFQRYPALHEILRWTGAALLLWVAWRIATAAGPSGADAAARPFTFGQAAAFQWINAKAWVMCVSVVAQFVTGGDTLRDALLCAFAAVIVSGPACSGWAGFGAMIGRWLRSPGRLRLFNFSMAALIVLGVVWMVLDRSG